jgi:hypothetical protein
VHRRSDRRCVQALHVPTLYHITMNAQDKTKYVQSLIDLGIKKEKLSAIISCSRPTFRRKLNDGDFTDAEISTLKSKIAETTHRKVA